MIRPTRRALLAWIAALLLAALPVVLGAGWRVAWFAGLAALCTALLADALLARGRRAFALELDAPRELFVGDPDPAQVAVRTAPAGAPRRVELRLRVSARLVEPPTCSFAVGADGIARGEVALLPRERGPARLEEAWLRWQGPLGLVERTARYPLGHELIAVPDVRAVRRAAIELARRSPWAGRKVERFQGDGSEFQTLREFVPGLDPRTIDWKSSARHRRLLCRELRAERNHPLVLAFDAGHRMREPIDGVSRLDRAINSALLLAFVALKAEDRVALFAFDAAVRAFAPFVTGSASFDRVRRAAAALEASTAETNYTLGLTELMRRLPRRALVVLFTDFTDAIGAELLVENCGRLARRHVVLLVAVRDAELDRAATAAPADAAALHQAVAAEELVRERARVLDRVRALGVLVLDAPAEQVRAGLIERYLEVQRRELVA